jgi:hypothetical protein
MSHSIKCNNCGVTYHVLPDDPKDVKPDAPVFTCEVPNCTRSYKESELTDTSKFRLYMTPREVHSTLAKAASRTKQKLPVDNGGAQQGNW